MAKRSQHSSRLTRWLEVIPQAGSLKLGEACKSVEVRFRLPTGLRIEEEGLAVGVVTLSSDSNGMEGLGVSPALRIMLMPIIMNGSLQKMIAHQRDVCARDGRAISVKVMAVGRIKIIRMILEPRRMHDYCEVGFYRSVENYVWSCATRTRADEMVPEWLTNIAGRILSTLEVRRSARVVGSVDKKARLTTREFGFSITVPEWERQDMVGLALLYAPGEGFRARTCFPIVASGQDWEGYANGLEESLKSMKEHVGYLKLVQSSWTTIGGKRVRRARFKGIIKRSRQRVWGDIAICENHKRLIFFSFLAKEGAEFDQFFPAHDAALQSLEWR